MSGNTEILSDQTVKEPGLFEVRRGQDVSLKFKVVVKGAEREGDLQWSIAGELNGHSLHKLGTTEHEHVLMDQPQVAALDFVPVRLAEDYCGLE